MNAEEIARVCHEANRAYCEAIGDNSQKPWNDAEQWQRDSAIRGVKFSMANPTASATAQHEAWLIDKLKDGWRYGPIKNATTKEHPCCLPYRELPHDQRRKDALFKAVVFALLT